MGEAEGECRTYSHRVAEAAQPGPEARVSCGEPWSSSSHRQDQVKSNVSESAHPSPKADSVAPSSATGSAQRMAEGETCPPCDGQKSSPAGADSHA